MAMLTSTNSDALATDKVGEALVQELVKEAIAFQVAQKVAIGATNYHVPVVQGDPSADWVAEGADIPLSDADIVELTITPKKVAALTKVSRELVNDNTSSQGLVMNGIIRDLSRKTDEALFGVSSSTQAPSGLEDLTGVTTVAMSDTAWVDLDPFAAAIANARSVTAEVNSFIAHPDDALALDQLKQGDGSNVPLLGADPTAQTKRSILGVPLFTSPYVVPGTIWGIPRDRVHAVVRTPAEVMTSGDHYFNSDSIAVRGTVRIGYAFPHEAAVQKIELGTAS